MKIVDYESPKEKHDMYLCARGWRFGLVGSLAVSEFIRAYVEKHDHMFVMSFGNNTEEE